MYRLLYRLKRGKKGGFSKGSNSKKQGKERRKTRKKNLRGLTLDFQNQIKIEKEGFRLQSIQGGSLSAAWFYNQKYKHIQRKGYRHYQKVP